MIGKITPLVQAASRRPWLAAVTLHLIGAAIAGTTSGWVLGLIGQPFEFAAHPVTIVAPIVLLAAGAILDSGSTPWKAPHLPRQTPAWFPCHFGYTWGALLWGLDLGLGWTTKSCFATYFGATALVVWLGSPAWGAIVLGMYGVARSIPVIAAGLASRRCSLQDLSIRPALAYPVLRLINVAALAWSTGFLSRAFLDYT